MPSSFSAATWSCISAISGETTTAQPVAQQRGNLEAQRLAAAGGHQHQRVAARRDGVDDGGLLAAERGVAEDTVEQIEGGIRRHAGKNLGRTGLNLGFPAGKSVCHISYNCVTFCAWSVP